MTLDVNAVADTASCGVPLTVITPVILCGPLVGEALGGPPSESILTAAVPATVPEITSLSDAPAPEAKFASRTTVPLDPEKSPVSVSVSFASESSPTFSVPATTSLPAVNAVPKEMTEPAPTLTVSQPVTLAPVSDPDTPLSARVLLVPAPPVSAPMPLMSVPLSVRSSESAASVTLPVIVAPLSTMTLSQPFRPSDTTVACRLPEPPLNFSMSPVPSPPSISVTFENVPPAKISASDPSPSVTLPAIMAPEFTVSVSPPSPRATLPLTVAPEFTVSASAPAPSWTFPVIAAPLFAVTVASPAPPMMALRAAVPTDAPLLSMMVTLLPDETSVLIAASVAPAPPVTVLDTVTVVAPVPS